MTLDVRTRRRQQEDLLIQQADTAGLVARKVANLQAVLRRKPLDRAAANALLPQLFTGIIVDDARDTKLVVLSWRQGGQNTLVYGVDSERPKRRL